MGGFSVGLGDLGVGVAENRVLKVSFVKLRLANMLGSGVP